MCFYQISFYFAFYFLPGGAEPVTFLDVARSPVIFLRFNRLPFMGTHQPHPTTVCQEVKALLARTAGSPRNSNPALNGAATKSGAKWRRSV